MTLVDTQSQLETPTRPRPVVVDLHTDQVDPKTESGSVIRRLASPTIIGIAWSVLPSVAGVLLLLNMEPIKLALIGNTGSTTQLTIGFAIYTIAFVILAGIGCLPTVSQAVLAGYAFGLTLGFPAALLGFAGASLVGYELVKHLARDRVEQELARSPKTSIVRHALLTASTKRSILIVALLRASPSAPFALTNLVLVSLGVSRKVFLIGTIVGMIPRTLAAVLIGVSITNWTGDFTQPKWIITAGIAATVALLIIISKVAASTLKKLSTD